MSARAGLGGGGDGGLGVRDVLCACNWPLLVFQGSGLDLGFEAARRHGKLRRHGRMTIERREERRSE